MDECVDAPSETQGVVSGSRFNRAPLSLSFVFFTRLKPCYAGSDRDNNRQYNYDDGFV